jgi:hypothetical protein
MIKLLAFLTLPLLCVSQTVGFDQAAYDSHTNPTIPGGALYASSLASYSSSNPTAAYYEAIESSNTFVVIDNIGGSPTTWAIDPKRVFSAPAKTIVYEDGVILKDRGTYPNNFTSLIDFANSDNIEIYGYGADAQLTRSAVTGEANHGAHFKSCDNIVFKGFKLTGIGTAADAGGDGFKTGSADTAHEPCVNLLAEDLIIDNHSRLGLALTNDVGTRLKNIKITGTNGRWPSGGIDIEPDNYQMSMDDVIIENITITGCDANAFQMGLYFMNTEYINSVQTQRPNFSNNVEVTVRDSYFYNNNLDLTKTTHGSNNNRFPETDNNLGDVRWGVLTGFLKYDNVQIDNSLDHAFWVTKREGSYDVQLDNVKINSTNTHVEPFRFNEGSGDGRNIGGVTITDMVLTTTNTTSFSEIVLQGASTLSNVTGNVYHTSPTTNDISYGGNADASDITNYNISFDTGTPPVGPQSQSTLKSKQKKSAIPTIISN